MQEQLGEAVNSYSLPTVGEQSIGSNCLWAKGDVFMRLDGVMAANLTRSSYIDVSMHEVLVRELRPGESYKITVTT